MEKRLFNNTSLIKVNTCIVGSGAAGYNAALRLWQYGQKDILLISENRLSGTSRNTGSDKQTYYKLTLSSDTPDSVYEMAKTLFDGESVDGDNALCEAALSAPSFLRLADLGIPFPTNRFGEYVGYKTDHDPRNRATSVGPYTSKKMTEALENDFVEKQIPFLDHCQVIKILSDQNQAYGLLCLNNREENEENLYTLIQCQNVVYATGGPAGIYKNSVYPTSQFGASGLAFEAGVIGKNLTEWQFGLASIKPRWNVSGTYMQVMPKVISTDEDGNDEREFLMDFFKKPEEMLSKLFLKGYQWPFDVRKVADGSSIIDILVYIELLKKRRIFLDFRSDPVNGKFSFDDLDSEAYNYLKKANALVEVPIKRLEIMNQPAIDFYKDKGVDLYNERLEISLCVQHNNGGLDIDLWWQSNLKGFFPVGEVAGSHGVYRPGGSALNASQVGSTRAAMYIANCCNEFTKDEETFKSLAENALKEINGIANNALNSESTVLSTMNHFTNLMSECAGAIRNKDKIETLLNSVDEQLANFDKVTIKSNRELTNLFRLRDILIAQKCYLSAYKNYIEEYGKS